MADAWRIQDKLCLVTGATGGIGRAITEELARRGARVLVVGRSQDSADAAVAEIRRTVTGAEVEPLACDLSSTVEVRALARAVCDRYDRLDVLVNNAAVVMFERRLTADGLEVGFAVNHLAPFLLTTSLLDRLRAAGHARVITVTSDNHKQVKSVPWDDLQGEREFQPLARYNRTKLMNVWFTRTLAERLAGTDVTANCVSPGFVRTRLARNATGFFSVFIKLAAPFQSSPAAAAATPVYLATDPDVGAVTGGYFSKLHQAQPGGLAMDDEAARRLWEISVRTCEETAAH